MAEAIKCILKHSTEMLSNLESFGKTRLDSSYGSSYKAIKILSFSTFLPYANAISKHSTLCNAVIKIVIQL